VLIKRPANLANVGYAVEKKKILRLRATTKEAGYEEAYHICWFRCSQRFD
jgi:hypothetical protein